MEHAPVGDKGDRESVRFTINVSVRLAECGHCSRPGEFPFPDLLLPYGD